MKRAGRDRKLVFYYAIHTQTLYLPPGSQNDNLQGHKAMTDMIWKLDKCIQLCLTRYVDGDGSISCCNNTHNQICSCCCACQWPAFIMANSQGSPFILHQDVKDWSTTKHLHVKTINRAQLPVVGNMPSPLIVSTVALVSWLLY